MGIITLGTILRDRGHEVRCFDSSFDPGPERVITELDRGRFDLVGVSCLTDAFPTASRFIEAAKATGAATVMGGPHPTVAAEDTLRAIPGLDYIVRGEGEEALPALVDCIGAGREPDSIPGLGFRRGEEIVLTGDPVPVADLDAIPIPDRDLLDVHDEYLRTAPSTCTPAAAAPTAAASASRP
ncbi:MAG: cobalamin-dependent protein [Chromatiales bacterium]|nr:cobalamin-dependent protein [Chromatiales bacterium]